MVDILKMTLTKKVGRKALTLPRSWSHVVWCSSLELYCILKITIFEYAPWKTKHIERINQTVHVPYRKGFAAGSSGKQAGKSIGFKLSLSPLVISSAPLSNFLDFTSSLKWASETYLIELWGLETLHMMYQP